MLTCYLKGSIEEFKKFVNLFMQVFLSIPFSSICLLHPIQWSILVFSFSISLANVAGL